MPVDEIIVLQVKHDELTGKVPFVPRFSTEPNRLCSEHRVVRGYKAHLFVLTKDTRPENQDYFGVYLDLGRGRFPCKVQFNFELVHRGWNPASTVRARGEFTYTQAQAWGLPDFISKARLASPDNNPYVKGGYVTFKCTFKIV